MSAAPTILAETAPAPVAVSFVVPAHDEEALLPETLAAIHAAARALGLAYEIVVADDASQDRTAALARAHGARVVAVGHRQIARTRNSGARAARGEVLVFVDADTRIGEPALRAALAAVERGAVGGGARPVFPDCGPATRALLGARAFLYQRARLAPGCFLFCRRADFEAVGGFDETLFAGEEVHLSRALARRGRFVALWQPVATSGRKLRTHSLREVFGPLLSPLWRGRRAFRDRRGLEVWYGARRADPPTSRRSGRSGR